MTARLEKCPLCSATVRAAPSPTSRDAMRFECGRCGRFDADAGLTSILDEELASPPPRHVLSAATRRASDHRSPLHLDHTSVAAIAATVAEPRGIMARLDRLVELLADKSARFNAPTTFAAERDYPLGVFLDEEEVQSLLDAAEERGWYQRQEDRLTLDGWEHADRLRAQRPRSRYAFVAMAFSEELRPAFDFGFRPGIEDSKYFEARRVDEIPHNDKICDLIIAELRQASLVVVDATGLRPSVFFEAGWAYGMALPVIWTCRADRGEALKEAFDTRQYNHILWTDPADLRVKLDARIRATVLPPA